MALPASCAPEAAAHLGRGLALLHNMTYGEAESEFDRARELDPRCALAYWGTAMTYVHPLWPDVPPDERMARGLALLAEAREKGAPDDHEAAYIAALESGTQKNPVTPGEVLPAAELLGDLLLEMGRHEEARAAYDAALNRSPNRLRSLLGAGRALEMAGDEKGARDYYRRALEGRVEGADHEGLMHARRVLGEG